MVPLNMNNIFEDRLKQSMDRTVAAGTMYNNSTVVYSSTTVVIHETHAENLSIYVLELYANTDCSHWYVVFLVIQYIIF